MTALRDTEGKLDWVLLLKHFPLALPELCRAREFGARYYSKDGKDGATNWRDSLGTKEHDKFMFGCVRGNVSHDTKFLWGEERDEPQDNVHHMAFAALNALMALEYALYGEKNIPPESEPKPSLRDILKRGHEMPDWLVELIAKRTSNDREGKPYVMHRFNWGESPEGSYFWWDVYNWQCGEGELPERPADCTGRKEVTHETSTRDILNRGHEMPDWLVNLIEERTMWGKVAESSVVHRFKFESTPEGGEFWYVVDAWQGYEGELPERPNDCTGRKERKEATHKPPIRDSLKRGREMPSWLVELIEERTTPGKEGNSFVMCRFKCRRSPEGSDFWRAIDAWQDGEGELPERPNALALDHDGKTTPTIHS